MSDQDQKTQDDEAALAAAQEKLDADKAAAAEEAAAAAAKAKPKKGAAPVKAVKNDGKEMPTVLPESVTLASQYGYYDDEGTLRMWQENQVVTDADQIEDLLERDAPLVAPAAA